MEITIMKKITKARELKSIEVVSAWSYWAGPKYRSNQSKVS